MALILLLVIFIIIVITAGLFLLTGNVAILGLIGVTIGAVFGILQTSAFKLSLHNLSLRMALAN